MNSEDVGIKVKLKKDFPVIRETLERMGIVNREKKIVYPSCYCVEGKSFGLDDPEGIFRIVHFKELFVLDNKESTIKDLDILRLKTIVYLLQDWGLIEPLEKIDEILYEPISVVSHKDKKDYRIVHKYRFVRQLK
jgi:hypothetical protein